MTERGSGTDFPLSKGPGAERRTGKGAPQEDRRNHAQSARGGFGRIGGAALDSGIGKEAGL